MPSAPKMMGRRVLGAAIIALLVAVALIPRFACSDDPRMQDVHFVKFAPDSPIEIKPAIVDIAATRGKTFTEIVESYHPYAAINGTFYASTFVPLGDILIDGKLKVKGRYPNAFAVTDSGKWEFVRRKGKSFDWTGYRCAVAAGPRLIEDGVTDLDPIADGFTQMSLTIKAPRSGIGLTKSGALLLVVCKRDVSLVEFAAVMRKLGAVEAMNLDGGPASGLYCNGKTLVDARLRMTNLLLVYKRGSGAAR